MMVIVYALAAGATAIVQVTVLVVTTTSHITIAPVATVVTVTETFTLDVVLDTANDVVAVLHKANIFCAPLMFGNVCHVGALEDDCVSTIVVAVALGEMPESRLDVLAYTTEPAVHDVVPVPPYAVVTNGRSATLIDLKVGTPAPPVYGAAKNVFCVWLGSVGVTANVRTPAAEPVIKVVPLEPRVIV